MVAGVVGRRLLYNERSPHPWHEFCEPVDVTGKTVQQVTREARCDVQYGVATPYGGLTLGGQDLDPSQINGMDNTNYIVMYPHDDIKEFTVLGTASNQFHILDNMMIAEALEPMLDSTQLETVGLLSDGAKVFWSFKYKTWSLRKPNGSDDENVTFFNFRDGKLPNESFSANLNYFRIECLNTYQMQDEVEQMVRVNHKIATPELIKWVSTTFSSMAKQHSQMVEQAQIMMDHYVTDSTWREALEYVYPIRSRTKLSEMMRNTTDYVQSYLDESEASYTAHEQSMKTYRLMADEAYQQDAAHEGVQGTVWGAFQAIANANCHYVSNPKRNNQTTKATIAFMFGSRAQFTNRAWEFLSNRKNWK